MEVTKEGYRFFIETMRRNGRTAAEINQYLVKAWGEEAPSQATVYRTYKDLASGVRTEFSDDQHCGRPKTVCVPERVDEVDKIITQNPRITIAELVEETGISQGSMYTIVTVYLQLTSRCSRWVPHALSPEQKMQRVEAAHDWMAIFENTSDADLLQRVVVVDEKYFYHRSIGTKETNRTWCLSDDDRQRVPRRVMNDTKSHVIAATNFRGHFHFTVLESQTVNSDVYITFLTEMHHKFVHQREALPWKKMVLIQDNARPHTSQKTMEFLKSKGVQVLRQPPYSPDFNLCDRWLFGMLERQRNNRNFQSGQDLEEFLQSTMAAIDKSALERQLAHLKTDLLGIIDAAGDYL